MNLVAVTDLMNRLPMVEWDRLTRHTDEEGIDSLQAYGWIRRPDGRDDFVLLDFEQVAYETEPRAGFTTSSARHSDAIHAVIFGAAAASDHIDCERVELVLHGVRNAVRIGTLDEGEAELRYGGGSDA